MVFFTACSTALCHLVDYVYRYPTTIKVPSAAPATLSYNADAAANAVLAHLNGVSLLPAATLSSGRSAGC